MYNMLMCDGFSPEVSTQ